VAFGGLFGAGEGDYVPVGLGWSGWDGSFMGSSGHDYKYEMGETLHLSAVGHGWAREGKTGFISRSA